MAFIELVTYRGGGGGGGGQGACPPLEIENQKNKKKPFRFSPPPLQIPGHATDIHIAIIIV